MITRSIKKNEVVTKTYVIDATNVRMGKLVAEIAKYLLGKNTISSVRYIPNKDKVIVINADKFSIHPSKGSKLYYWHSGYMGGLHSENLGDLKENKTEKVLRKSVWGMLPKNRLGRSLLRNLEIRTDDLVENKNSEFVKII
jgi:large subunit ribosomal protein L13